MMRFDLLLLPSYKHGRGLIMCSSIIQIFQYDKLRGTATKLWW